MKIRFIRRDEANWRVVWEARHGDRMLLIVRDKHMRFWWRIRRRGKMEAGEDGGFDFPQCRNKLLRELKRLLAREAATRRPWLEELVRVVKAWEVAERQRQRRVTSILTKSMGA